MAWTITEKIGAVILGAALLLLLIVAQKILDYDDYEEPADPIQADPEVLVITTPSQNINFLRK